MRRLLAAILVAVGGLTIAGCGDGSGGRRDGWDDGVPAPLLDPFAGAWTCSVPATLAAREAAGVPAEETTRLREFLEKTPGVQLFHSDFTIRGNLAIGAGLPSSEYRFFSLHRHGPQVCGKAWHHEDRFNPGDMSKCYVRLELVDGRLHFRYRMQDGLIDLNDPDLKETLAVVGDAAGCTADKPPGGDWSEWMLLVFDRKR